MARPASASSWVSRPWPGPASRPSCSWSSDTPGSDPPGRTGAMPRTVRVRDRMRPGTVAVAWSDSAEAALARMREAGLGAVPVVDDQRVIGLLERAAVLACERNGNWLGAVPVASLMRRGVLVCRAEDSL